MKTVTPKKRVIRQRVKAGNSPSPNSISKCGPCGHSECSDNCRVRHIGPTSHIRDHHVLHAARGVAHIWSAVIIAGFAVVLTGAISYHVANAENQKTEQNYRENSTEQIINKIESLERRLDVMESDIEGMFRASSGAGNNATPESVFPPLN
jgi:hypothetical protein